MKIRIQGNCLRFRLTRTEVARFAEDGRYESVIEFPTGRLRYAVEAARSLGQPEAAYESDLVLVRLPEGKVHDWAEGDEVALAGSQDLPSGMRLEIIVEKDFQCLHKGDEAKDPDAYPNPAEARA